MSATEPRSLVNQVRRGNHGVSLQKMKVGGGATNLGSEKKSDRRYLFGLEDGRRLVFNEQYEKG